MMKIPIATYRLQFTPDFGFEAAQAIAPYLSALGISDIYASPILQSRQGSTHGYDGVDPTRIDPELGGREKFDALCQVVQHLGLGWLQDIVPNHMAFDSQNAMLMDVLENGPDSEYRDFFDIDWSHPYEDIHGRVLAPFLGKFYGDCLESGELQLRYGEPGLSLHYYNAQFPVRLESYYRVLTYNLDHLRRQLGRDHPAYIKLLGVLYMLKYIPAGQEGRERYGHISFIKRMLWELWNDSPEVHDFVETNVRAFNGKPGEPESFDLLDSLLDEQFFRLAYWKVGNEELNYRRFFTVNELICLRVEDEAVFEATHQLILELVKAGQITGLRIDHIDGLYDPTEYLRRLRQDAPEVYLTVEKILEPQESLPLSWPVQGTTGYDFLNQVNGVLCDRQAVGHLEQIYHQFLGRAMDCAQLVDQNKRLIVDKHLAGDIDNLARMLKTISGRYRYASDFTMFGLKSALEEILAIFPVYRTYINREGASRNDQDYIKAVIRHAKGNIPDFFNELEFIERFLLLKFDESLSEEDREAWLRFLMRLQQFTGPLMAKGVEDTVLYLYNRLTSLNEVGSSPQHFGLSLEDFHRLNRDLAAQWPHTMNATATHDTKRGEDMRSRINVISELPDEWREKVYHWRNLNQGFRSQAQGQIIPTANDEYFFYQTLLGVFPFEDESLAAVVQRLKAYLIKAIREAKVNTAWIKPNQAYEEGFMQFVDCALGDCQGPLDGSVDPPWNGNQFLESFVPFVRKVQHYGMLNSLSQTLLKFTVPGVPDIYQGTELWDFSMVDPDNRRPVDFDRRLSLLQDLEKQESHDSEALLATLLDSYRDGRIKLFLTRKLLQARHQYQALFQRGGYEPLNVAGSLKGHVIAFERALGGQRLIAIAPRLMAAIAPSGTFPFGEQVWYETRIQPPTEAGTGWRDLITGDRLQAEDTLWLRDVLKKFPVALLVNEPQAGAS